MSVTDVRKDVNNLTMTVESEWKAPIASVWQLWADPRKLERWWGPPTYPATIVDHDLTPGGRVNYYMTGPEGERFGGWWEITEVEEPRRLAFRDGFANEDGSPNESMPTTEGTVTLSEQPGGVTRMVIESRFPSKEAMDQLTEMGMEDGMREALGQIDTVLASG